MGYIVPNYIYYACFGLAIALTMFLSVGTLYIGKVRNNMQVSFTNEGTALPITKKEKFLRLAVLVIGLVGLAITEFFVIPGGGSGAEVTKTVLFGCGLCCFGILAVLDVKYGEVYVYELGVANTLLLFIFPIIVNFIFGCQCISKGLLITFGVYILIKIINYALNKELSIGGADIDTMAALAAAAIGVFPAINHREQTPIFVESYFLERLLSLIFVNFTASILIFFVVKLIKKFKHKEVNEEQENVAEVSKDLNDSSVVESKESIEEDNKEENEAAEKRKKADEKMNFRCLPSFILVYAFILFFILFY